MREAASQRPLNIVARNIIAVADTIPPKPKFCISSASTQYRAFPYTASVENYRSNSPPRDAGGSPEGTRSSVSQTGYFAVEAEEKKSGTANPMGIYTIDALMDGAQFFAMTVDAIPFDLTRYSYATALYPESRGTRNGVYRLCSLPNNPLQIYNGTARRGIIALRDDDVHDIDIALGDDCGNRSVALVRRIRLASAADRTSPGTRTGIPVRWNEDFSIRQAKASRSSFPKRSPLRIDPAES